jgi:hypothetical protein
MKRMISLSAVLLAFGFVGAAADPSPTRQARSVPAFHAIDLAGVIEVEVTIGKPASVEVTGDAALFDKVITTVKDGVLVVDTRLSHHDQRGRHQLKALVTTPSLTSLAVSGAGDIKVAGIANDDLTLTVPGVGAITATGSTSVLHVKVGGAGEVAAKDLAAKDATVEVSGTGDATVRATQSLDARISGAGSIEVHGRPARIKKSVTGVGDIRIR